MQAGRPLFNVRSARRQQPHAAAIDRPSRPLDQTIAVMALLAIVATGVFGTLAAGGFIVAALMLIALRPMTAGRELLQFWPLLLLPALAIVSTLWSDAPERTMRAGLQLMLTCIAAIMVARRLDGDRAILTLFIGYAVICALALPAVPASISGGLPLAGPFQSKNQMGFASHLLFALALAVMVDSRQPGVARVAAIVAAPISIGLLSLSNSGGAFASVGITLIVFPALVIFGRLPRRGRLVALLILLVGLIVGALLLGEIGTAIDDFRENVLHKDATLTGRTYLWAYAERLVAERPWLGAGYYAFWRHGNLDAEGLWRWGGISARSGFNFHNAFVEMQVDLGWAGLALLIAMCVGIAVAGGYRQFNRPTVPVAFFLAFLAVTYARSLTETGMIAPFSAVTVFCLATAVYVFAPSRAGADHGRRQRAGGRRGDLPGRAAQGGPDQSRPPARAYNAR